MELDLSNPIPLHAQLKSILRAEILQGEFNERIPSERELVERFSVSRATVRKAISELVHEGVLEKKHGKGTFISHRPVEEWLGNLSTYNEVIDGMGMKPSTKLLSQGVDFCSPHISNVLGTDKIYFIERLRYADNVPLAVEKQYYPLQIGLQLKVFDLSEAVLYDLLELSLGIKLWEAEQIISSALPSKDEAENLGIEGSKGVLVAERITYDPEGNPVEYLKGVFREDMYAFRMNLARRRG